MLIFIVKKGDSGGPLYVIENSRHIVAGISSYVKGPSCGGIIQILNETIPYPL
jgi:hypothetical protein